jgi:cobalt-zinc-cadmium efflux system outer membrane protein
MSMRRLLALSSMLLLGGCLFHARERTDQVTVDLAAQPYDAQPAEAPDSPKTMPKAEAKSSAGHSLFGAKLGALRELDRPTDVQTAAWMEGDQVAQPPEGAKPKYELTIPPEIPGAESKRLEPLPKDPAAKERAIDRTYPKLPALSAEPIPQPGPGGKPYTLSDLQQLAAANSPTLRQAASDVEAARGNWIQARAYPNPTIGWNVQPSNDGETAGVQGPFIDQTIKFAGKIKLATAAAEMDLRNAELALRRARSDLSTNVRNAYFGVLVAKESVRVNKALAHFTDEIYRLQVDLLRAGLPATYEPMALQAQAYTARLAYKQAIQNYVYAWKQLVATIGLRQLPLSDVAGRIDRFIPFYDFDSVLAHVLNNHTDALIARNVVEKARYSVKIAQIAPFPDVDINFSLLKEYALAPKQMVHTVTLGMPFPIWDRNRGNTIAAEAALVRATEEPHRVETALTNTLSNNYNNYKNALDALEYYRRYILPDQVRYYRGVFDRRQIDPGAAFGDLVQAQQTLAANVGTYLTILGQLWTSVVSLADLLQTDDLFQLAQPREVPELPDLEALPPWPCCHDAATCPLSSGDGTVGFSLLRAGAVAPATGAIAPVEPMPANPLADSMRLRDPFRQNELNVPLQLKGVPEAARPMDTNGP